MNKSDLIDTLAKKENLTAKESEKIIDIILNGFTEIIKSGGRIEIRGFGSFSMREYESYTGRNPKTGDGVAVKPKRLPFFKVGKDLKSKVDRR